MSSSDSDTPQQKRAPVKRGAAAASSDSDSEDDNRKRVMVRGGRAGGRGAAQAKKEDDDEDTDSDSDDDAPNVPAQRRPAQRKAAGGSSDSDSDSDSDSGAEAEADSGVRKGGRQVQLWLPVNYDDMDDDSFYAMLKDKSRQQRQEEKRQAEQQIENTKGEAEEPVEFFTDESIITDVDLIKGYKYSDMLQRIYSEIRLKNPELGDGSHKRVKLPVPKTEKSGTKTTALSNFKEMCKAMGRDMDHVKDFIEKELTTSTAIDGNFCLIMKVRNVKAMQIEHVFQKYVEEYCQCGNCGGIDTVLEKNPANRLWVLKCKSCRASRTVQAAANATYKAQIGRRKHL